MLTDSRCEDHSLWSIGFKIYFMAYFLANRLHILYIRIVYIFYIYYSLLQRWRVVSVKTISRKIDFVGICIAEMTAYFVVKGSFYHA